MHDRLNQLTEALYIIDMVIMIFKINLLYIYIYIYIYISKVELIFLSVIIYYIFFNLLISQLILVLNIIFYAHFMRKRKWSRYEIIKLAPFFPRFLLPFLLVIVVFHFFPHI